MRAARPFRYCLDPVCLGAIASYLVNRFVVKPATGDAADFWHCYLNDVVCLPIWVPAALWLQRRFGLRKHDLPPTQGELAFHWCVWSWLFEVLGPTLHATFPRAVADPWDVVAYSAGAVAGAVLWRSRRDPATLGAPGRPRIAWHVASLFLIFAAMVGAGVCATLTEPLHPAQLHLGTSDRDVVFRRDLDVSVWIAFLIANGIAFVWLLGRSTTRPPFRTFTRGDVAVFVLQLTLAVLLGVAVLASDRSGIGVH